MSLSPHPQGSAVFSTADLKGAEQRETAGRMLEDILEAVTLRLRDHKGGDMAEWPADLRVREYPTVRA